MAKRQGNRAASPHLLPSLTRPRAPHDKRAYGPTRPKKVPGSRWSRGSDREIHLFRGAAPDDGTLDVLESGEDTVRATLGGGAEFRL